MPWAAAAVVAGAGIGAAAQSSAASKAASAQTTGSLAGINAETKQLRQNAIQFQLVSDMFKPYRYTGTKAIRSQRALLGLSGPAAQRKSINRIEKSPELQAMMEQGENALLQNAAATGGLRGGNTQAALAQYRPAMLNQAIQQRFANLGQLSSLGQASAARTADVSQGYSALGSQGAANISNLYGQIGAAQAGGALGQGQAYSNIGNTLTTLGGIGLSGGF